MGLAQNCANSTCRTYHSRTRKMIPKGVLSFAYYLSRQHCRKWCQNKRPHLSFNPAIRIWYGEVAKYDLPTLHLNISTTINLAARAPHNPTIFPTNPPAPYLCNWVPLHDLVNTNASPEYHQCLPYMYWISVTDDNIENLNPSGFESGQVGGFSQGEALSSHFGNLTDPFHINLSLETGPKSTDVVLRLRDGKTYKKEVEVMGWENNQYRVYGYHILLKAPTFDEFRSSHHPQLFPSPSKIHLPLSKLYTFLTKLDRSTFLISSRIARYHC
ncbi:uncharacterized protein BDR25DRAFT_361340 [Lindgomyces ingoldianus]|uniref:Uncharacterized protein n=1 Tax=Lindgomyces ingoldianus TaxID=673940 RepID=A0ACB6QEL7_9PLEO|nr:uncharacterized protein BDR25DRAFT_361340 [Lindgomyces ingoldianus]KAF2464802.1 hypothetical protein BDR25DRAFT_361340 [Lindgomyces ingoldianus]